MTGPTNFTEANALLAIAEGDLDTAREIIAGMLPGECRRLAEHAYKLGDLLHERDRIDEALDGLCRWGHHCQQASHAYIMVRGKPIGICQRHRADAVDNGYAIHERPAPVPL